MTIDYNREIEIDFRKVVLEDSAAYLKDGSRIKKAFLGE